jgi:IS30 family transposase
LLRQYFPKGTDLSVHSPARLLEVVTELNADLARSGWNFTGKSHATSTV